MRPYFIFLLARGLTSHVLALLGPGFPSAPPFMEWVYRASVFLSFSLRPDILPKASIKESENLKDSSDPYKMSVVSSAYWINLNLVSCILISLLVRMASASILQRV